MAQVAILPLNGQHSKAVADQSHADAQGILREQAESLQRLIEEAKRIQRDLNDHVNRLRHAADADTTPQPKARHSGSRKR